MENKSPRFIPRKLLFINKNAQKFNWSQTWLRIIDKKFGHVGEFGPINLSRRIFVRKFMTISLVNIIGQVFFNFQSSTNFYSGPSSFVPLDYVSNWSGSKKVLLLQSQFQLVFLLARVIQNTGQLFRFNLLFDSFVILALIE